ncbi:MAG: NTP transferase domain-containing protein [Sporomusaceae bacterium]|nr:NTP transferase domain-containing protein [Sporomusaceae bacterium]
MRRAGKLAAIILAAGCSSRAPGFKPLLPLGEATVIETAVGGLRRAGIGDIAVVVGHRAADLQAVLGKLPVRTVPNEHYRAGMFSSVVAGVKALPADADAFFLLPADLPLVKSHTVRLLARAGRKTGAAVVYPVFGGQRGHPPLIAARLAPAILGWGGTGGLRPLLARYEADALDLSVIDEGILLDLDTAADYRQLVMRHAGRHCPTGKECEQLLARLGVPSPVADHSRVVAGVARRLAAGLNRAGCSLDEGLITAASLLHDLAKGRPDHPRRGARLIGRLGCPQVAAVVAAHHDKTFAAGQPLDEAAVVYLADKLVQNATIVSLEERFSCPREKFADAAAQKALSERLAQARRIAAAVEQALGAELAAIIKGDSPLPAGGDGI